METSEVYFD